VLRVEVTDSGPGINRSQIPKLFKRFQQADSGINRKYGGSGLGLAICRDIIRLMEGEIGVDSEVGKGSTFWFEIPLVPSTAEPADEARSGAIIMPEKLNSILLVDDHEINRKLIRRLIEPYAMAIAEATNGAEAIALCQEARFDLILMDIQMPEIDGVTATRMIRSLCPLNDQSLVVALTAISTTELARNGGDRLFDHVLLKPIDPANVYLVLSNLLRNPERKTSAAKAP